MSNKNPSFEEIILGQPSGRAMDWLNHQIAVIMKKVETAERIHEVMPMLDLNSTVEIDRQLLELYKQLRQDIQWEEI